MGIGIYIVVVAVLVIYYAWAMFRVGRDPETGSLAACYEPPAGMSPAEVRYAWKGCVDERSVACVLAQLAVEGRITIVRQGDGYEIQRVEAAATSPESLAPEEQVAMDWLFANLLRSLHFHPQHDGQGLLLALRGSLERRLRGKYLATHFGYIAIGLLFSLIAAYGLARNVGWNRVPPPLVYGQFLAALLASITVTAVFIPAVLDYLRGIGSIGRIIFGLMISAFGTGAAVAIAMRFRESVPVEFPVAVIALAMLNVVPAPWLRRVTQQGMKARIQIEGYREFLERVEQDRLDRSNPPTSTLQSKPAMLPFAIALEVRETWGDSLVNACFPHLITG